MKIEIIKCDLCEVEKLAKELIRIWFGEDLAIDEVKDRENWNKLARFVMRREIEAKIEGYEKAKAFFIINEQNSEAFEIINLNIAELRRELKGLEGGKCY